MSLDRRAIYTPRKGDTLTIRGEALIDGRTQTTQWGFQMTSQGIWVPGADFGMRLDGKIIRANIPSAEDDRIAQQRRSIDIMLDHLKAHCPRLLGTGECEHIGNPESTEVKL